MDRKNTYEIDGFEVSKEVLEKRNNSSAVQSDMDDNMLCVAEYIDVSHHWYRFLKRAIDVVASFVGLMVLLLPLSLVAIAIFVDDPGPIFFRQYRIGRHGKRFRIFKFRSMRKETPKYVSTTDIHDSGVYITRVGRWIRKFSIDELPQLLNVLIGDMSLVGPRPLISDEYEIHRLRVKHGVYNTRPGITGMAQVHGRDKVEPIDKVRWDVLYLQKFGLWTDLGILFTTIPMVLWGKDVVEGRNSISKSA